MRSDARFASDVSHELRSPLTTMLGVVGLLQAQRAALPASATDAVELLEEEVGRFERLVADLLEISRTDAGAADLALEEVVLADLVAHALPAGGHSRLTVAPGAERAVVRGDKRRLERVVAHLVENAEKHGGGLVRVLVQAVDGLVQCIVEDAGPGVPAEERHLVFQRFARGRGTARDSTEGSGLGLALVAQHVHVLGGTVHVEDRPGGGARFVVTLPTRDESCDS